MMEVMEDKRTITVIHTIQQAAEVVRDILVKELFRKYARAVVDRKQKVTVIGRGQTMLVVETVVLVLI